MPITISCVCGKTLQVKDEFASRRIRCPVCGQVAEAPAAEPVFEVVDDATAPGASSSPITRVRARPVDSPTDRNSRGSKKSDRDEAKGYALADVGSAKPRRKPQRDDDEDDRPRRRPRRRRSVRSSGGGDGLKRVGYLLGGFAMVGLGIALVVLGWNGEGKNATKALVFGGCLVFCGFGSGFKGATGNFGVGAIGGDDTGGGDLGGDSDGAGGSFD
jgi:hypothetical protein